MFIKCEVLINFTVLKPSSMNEDISNYLNQIRRDFSGKSLSKASVHQNPMKQYALWFEEAVNAQLLDPYAMALTTVGATGQPATRIVYMRGIEGDGFVFYTNYKSDKGKDIEMNNKVALNFFWGGLERQIRVEGVAEKISGEASDVYFAQRPRESQIGAWASAQSQKIDDRKQLEEHVAFYTEKFKTTAVPRPQDRRR